MKAYIHAGGLPHHKLLLAAFQEGMAKLGFDPVHRKGKRDDEKDDPGFHVLIGTSFWRNIEYGDYLMVDASPFDLLGDVENHVSLLWGGHPALRGDHMVPEGFTPDRWESFGIRAAPMDYRKNGKVVLCGQTEPYCDKYEALSHWYMEVDSKVKCTHFKPHPRGGGWGGAPVYSGDFTDVRTAHVLNSSVSVKAFLGGACVVGWDDACLTNKAYAENWSQKEFLAWAAWTSWSHAEIAAGEPIKHLFEKPWIKDLKS